VGLTTLDRVNRTVAFVVAIALLTVSCSMASQETTTSPAPSTSPDDSPTTPSTENDAAVIETTTVTTGATDETAKGATGTGVVVVDGTTYDVTPVACGWLSDQPSPRGVPLESEMKLQDNFRLVAAARVDDGLFVIDMERDGDIGVVSLTVVRAVPSASAGNYLWGNDRISRLTGRSRGSVIDHISGARGHRRRHV
jgi:hypothetical protein